MVNQQSVLVTGGLGYIGSHTVVQLIQAGYSVVVLDNLSNSKRDVIKRIHKITNVSPAFIEGDICDGPLIQELFEKNKIDAVLHFAGLKSVSESVEKPFEYYSNNVSGSLILFAEMARAGVKDLVFSSSATIYGASKKVPITEDCSWEPINPYGHSKLMVECMLRDQYTADPAWNVAILRYFNPVGAHPSGWIGEDPNGTPNNLMPFVAQVAIGKREKLTIFGNDYPTPDGTGVRDYIHVEDLASGHLAALKALRNKCGITTINLGTGKGYSVLDIVRTFEAVSGRVIPFEVAARRTGDVALCYADPSRAKSQLGWEAVHDIQRMCEDVWRWESMLSLRKA